MADIDVHALNIIYQLLVRYDGTNDLAEFIRGVEPCGGIAIPPEFYYDPQPHCFRYAAIDGIATNSRRQSSRASSNTQSHSPSSIAVTYTG